VLCIRSLSRSWGFPGVCLVPGVGFSAFLEGGGVRSNLCLRKNVEEYPTIFELWSILMVNNH
jgi:hypothetical protein